MSLTAFLHVSCTSAALVCCVLSIARVALCWFPYLLCDASVSISDRAFSKALAFGSIAVNSMDSASDPDSSLVRILFMLVMHLLYFAINFFIDISMVCCSFSVA